jgi:hypothetical protein
VAQVPAPITYTIEPRSTSHTEQNDATVYSPPLPPQNSNAVGLRTVFTRGNILRLTKKAYLLTNDEDLDEDITRIYNQSISWRLAQRLELHINRRDNKDAYIQNLNLAGKSPSTLSPTIVIWCSNKYVFQQVLERVRNFNFLRIGRLPVMAYVDQVEFCSSSDLAIGLGVGLGVGGLGVISLALFTFLLRRRLSKKAPLYVTQADLSTPVWIDELSPTINLVPPSPASESGPPPYSAQPRHARHLQGNRPTSYPAEHGVRVKLLTFRTQDSPEMFFGIPLQILREGGSEEELISRCSMGRILEIGEKLYGFTVGHVLLEPTNNASRSLPEQEKRVAFINFEKDDDDGDGGDSESTMDDTQRNSPDIYEVSYLERQAKMSETAKYRPNQNIDINSTSRSFPVCHYNTTVSMSRAMRRIANSHDLVHQGFSAI